jgi:hypothetical protein
MLQRKQASTRRTCGGEPELPLMVNRTSVPRGRQSVSGSSWMTMSEGAPIRAPAISRSHVPGEAAGARGSGTPGVSGPEAAECTASGAEAVLAPAGLCASPFETGHVNRTVNNERAEILYMRSPPSMTFHIRID